MKLNEVIPMEQLLSKAGISRIVLNRYQQKGIFTEGEDFVRINNKAFAYSLQALETLKQYKATHKGGRRKGIKSSYSIPSL